MMQTIPLSAIKLGFDFEEYGKLIKNMGRMVLLSQSQREGIIKKGNEKIPNKIKGDIFNLIFDLSNERLAYNYANLPYHEGPPQGKNLFSTAVVDYLLRNKI